jgi:hypothetical protein
LYGRIKDNYYYSIELSDIEQNEGRWLKHLRKKIWFTREHDVALVSLLFRHKNNYIVALHNKKTDI